MKQYPFISRDHKFENRLTYVEQREATYALFHEKDKRPVLVERTLELDLAFVREDWLAFVSVEATALGGPV